MVSKEEVAAAFNAAGEALGLDGDELGDLLFTLSQLSEEQLKFFPTGAAISKNRDKAIVAFARSARASAAGLRVESAAGAGAAAGVGTTRAGDAGAAAGLGVGSVAGAGSLPAAAEAAVHKEVIINYDPPANPTLKKFKSHADLEKWLTQKRFIGLLKEENGEVVDDWEQLETGCAYKPFLLQSLEFRVSSLESHSRHLNMRREEEFGEAVRQAAVVAEGVTLEDAELLPEARQLGLPDGQSKVETDAVVLVKKGQDSVAYLGLHKTYTDGTGDVMEAVASRHTVEKLAKDPAVNCPPQLKAATAYKVAFMAEVVGPRAAVAVSRYCRQNGVMRLARSHGSIVRIL